MKLEPRYDGPVIVAIDDEPQSQLVPVSRQRRRFQQMLTDLDEQQWRAASRCDAWTTRDIVAHLVTVNAFWSASIAAGLAGKPSRMLATFDPAASPPQLVDTMSSLSTREVFERFVSTNEALLDALDALTTVQWSVVAESPVGHVPIRLLAQHALWDCWIHERDVVLPLGIPPTVEADEVVSSLRYAAVAGPAMGMGVGCATAGVLAVETSDPSMRFMLEVAGSVTLRDAAFDEHAPCLRGDAVSLTESLSLRRPLDSSAPMEWREMLGGLEAAFGA